MAITYGFYNSLNKDRVYNAEQMSSIFNGIITDGVFSTIGDALMPIAGTGMQVIVKTGKCWFNSTWTLNDALLPLNVEASDVSLTRIDAIVVEIDSSIGTRANTIKMLKGTPSANPAKPALANSEHLHQYALGYVTVSAGATSITADKIEVNVGKATCPFITSVLQQTDITDLFNQWDAEFSAWFANVQSQLSGDIAANLQRQIDLKVNISDKATASDMTSGADDKWVTPKLLYDGVSAGIEIGDIRASARNLEAISDGKYLKCDGRYLTPGEYPDLYSQILDGYGGSPATIKTVGIGNATDIQPSKNGNTRGFEYFVCAAANSVGQVLAVYLPYIRSNEQIRVAIHNSDGSVNAWWDISENSGHYDYGCAWLDDNTPVVARLNERRCYVYVGKNVTTPTYQTSTFNTFGSWYVQKYNDTVLIFINAPDGTFRVLRVNANKTVSAVKTFSVGYAFSPLFILGNRLYGCKIKTSGVIGTWGYIDVNTFASIVTSDPDDVFLTSLAAEITNVKDNSSFGSLYSATAKDLTTGAMTGDNNTLVFAYNEGKRKVTKYQKLIGPYQFVGDKLCAPQTNSGSEFVITTLNLKMGVITKETYTISVTEEAGYLYFSNFYGAFPYCLGAYCDGKGSSRPGAIYAIPNTTSFRIPEESSVFKEGSALYIRAK